MDAPPPPTPVLTIDTGRVAALERVEFLREGLKDTIGSFGVEAVDGAPMRQVFELRSLPSFDILSLHTSPVRVTRRGDIDGDEILSFNLMQSGRGLSHRQLGRSIEMAPGQATLVALYEPYGCDSTQSYDFEVLRLSRRALATRVADPEAAIASVISDTNPALQLLSRYLVALKAMSPSSLGALAEPVSDHIHDLVAMALGPSRDGIEQARQGGVRAARRAAIQDHIARSLTDPALSSRQIARRFAVSDRYLRQLFAEDGGIWNYVVQRRMALAARMLSDPGMTAVKIIDVAYRCGFNSVSAFNRLFRDAFGHPPSALRPPPARRSA